MRAFNFSAGPATLPESVLHQAAAEMLDWQGCGMGVMEMSHRGPEFTAIHARAQADVRDLLAVPRDYHILFLQGGAIAENAILPLNLMARCGSAHGLQAQYVITGSWSQKSAKEAGKYGQVQVLADTVRLEGGVEHFTRLPGTEEWQSGLQNAAHSGQPSAYVHLCSNETIHGVEFHELPDLKAMGCEAPLVIDCSSHLASRPIDWSKVAVAYGGAQKNIGPAGLTLVIIREDLLGHALPICPSAFNYKVVADNGSMYNTPPTYAIYMAGLVFQWLKAQGGIEAMEARNIAKAQLLYDYLDASALYENRVDTAGRSRMNVPFFLKDESLNAAFLEGAQNQHLLQLKGHKSVGGMRASLYNAMPLQGVQALVHYMEAFEKKHR